MAVVRSAASGSGHPGGAFETGSCNSGELLNSVAMKRQERGYTLFELLVVVTLIGAVAALAIPRVKGPLLHESVRGARRAVVTHLAVARGAAASRGCRSVVHFVDGADARTWVTTCNTSGIGVDTVGTVEQLSDRYGVSVACSVDSLTFAPNGLSIGGSWASIAFDRTGYSDTLTVSPLGKAYW
jgi:prepilin-type N-terminal cleavage/methylation domain-containing protein